MSRRLHPALETSLDIGAFQVASDFRALTKFASGKPANNKFIGDLIFSGEQSNESQDEVIFYMADLVVGTEFRPKPRHRTVLYGIPSGGQEYAKQLGRASVLNLEVAHLEKVDNLDGLKTYRPATRNDALLLSAADDLIAIEDTGTELTSLHGALYSSSEHGLGVLAAKTRGAVIFMQRGRLSEARSLHVPMRPLITQYIPNMIDETDPFLNEVGDRVVWLEPGEAVA